MALREHIAQRALVFVDEVQTTSAVADASLFPVEEVIDEAARWVIRAVPLHLLGTGLEMPVERLVARADGSGELPLPDDFMRLLRFRMEGWRRPVIVPLRDTDEAYAQQFDPLLRGGECRPVVVLCDASGRLEYYSSSRGCSARVAEARYFGFTEVNDDYPERLADLTAWKTAERVLAVMTDAAAMQLCAGRVNDIMQSL